MSVKGSEGYELWGQRVSSDGDPATFLEDVQYLGEAYEYANQWREGDNDLAVTIKDKATGEWVKEKVR